MYENPFVLKASTVLPGNRALIGSSKHSEAQDILPALDDETCCGNSAGDGEKCRRRKKLFIVNFVYSQLSAFRSLHRLVNFASTRMNTYSWRLFPSNTLNNMPNFIAKDMVSWIHDWYFFTKQHSHIFQSVYFYSNTLSAIRKSGKRLLNLST